MNIKRFAMAALAVAMAFVVSACTTASIDTAIRQQLPAVCANAKASFDILTVANTTGKVKASVYTTATIAYEELAVPCANPSQQTLLSTLIAATNAYNRINAALRAARLE